MGLLHAIHFDAGVIPPEISIFGAASVVSTTQKRTGAYSLKLPPDYNFRSGASLNLSSAQSEFFVQFAWYFTGYGWGDTYCDKLFRWRSAGGTVLGGVKLNDSSHKLELYTGSFVTLVATGVTPLAINTLYIVELHIKIEDSTGTIVLRVDLNEEVAFVGDTKPGGDTSVGLIDFGAIGTFANYQYVDDIIVNDPTGTINNSWPNGAKVYYMVPTGDGATKEWTPSAGSDHYALVDEVPPSPTDNLQATAIDKVDIFTFDDLPGDAQSVKAVIPEVYGFKGSSTAPSRVALGLEISAEGEEYSADKDMALSQGIVRNIWELRPGGGLFSVADIGNLSLYLKSAA